MKKKAVFVALIIIVIMAVIFGLFAFAISFKEDKQLTQKAMNKVITSYENFIKSVEQYAKERDTLYKKLENTYLEDFSKSINEWNTLINNYQKNIQNIEKNSKTLKKYCNIKYADPNINSKCTIFKSTYEAANNYYISDIKSYNETVKEYNQWAENNNKEKLNEGKLYTYKDYIDYDGDKDYFGKEENNG